MFGSNWKNQALGALGAVMLGGRAVHAIKLDLTDAGTIKKFMRFHACWSAHSVEWFRLIL